MPIREYEHVKLKNGLSGHIIEIFGDQEALEFERDDAPYLDDDVEPWFTISLEDIEAILC